MDWTINFILEEYLALVSLEERTDDTVRVYFEKANTPQIKKLLPQKAQTIEEALADYGKTLLPNANSFILA